MCGADSSRQLPHEERHAGLGKTRWYKRRGTSWKYLHCQSSLFKTQLRANPFVETRSRQRIGDGYPNVIGLSLPDQVNGLLNVFPGFPRVPKLNEETGA